MPNALNGWNVEEMTAAVEGIRAAPEAGKLKWTGQVRWDGGFGLDVRTQGIEQAGDRIDRHFTLRGDHPPELLGDNTGPTAIETLLAALGACMAGTFAAQATARGVALDGLEVDVSADLDLNGFFGLQPVAPGVSNIALRFAVAADADDEMLARILEATRQLSPIHDTVSTAKPVRATLDRRQPGGGQ